MTRATSMWGHELRPVVVAPAYVGNGRYERDGATGMWWGRETGDGTNWRIYARDGDDYSYVVHACRIVGTDAYRADREVIR